MKEDHYLSPSVQIMYCKSERIGITVLLIRVLINPDLTAKLLHVNYVNA